MSGDIDRSGMQAVVERLARLEAQSDARGEAFREMRITMSKLDDKITLLDGKIDKVSTEIRAAQTGFRVALWFASGIAAIMGGLGTILFRSWMDK